MLRHVAQMGLNKGKVLVVCINTKYAGQECGFSVGFLGFLFVLPGQYPLC